MRCTVTRKGLKEGGDGGGGGGCGRINVAELMNYNNVIIVSMMGDGYDDST